mmetsp:Transcript_42850/g.118455  ORF Transcript_42850/g.118455 Transcript_42850/m.118455 type:complete len:400 (-) Transcript_42850:11-1210(-)
MTEGSDGTMAGSGTGVGSMYGKIPRVIWMLWLDGWEKAPELQRRCLQSWQLFNERWEVRAIARRDFPRLLGDFLPAYERLRTNMNPLEKYGGFWIPPAAESDLLRLVLLTDYGGIWIDSTMLCRRPLDEWLPESAANGFFAFSPECLEQSLVVMSSFLASMPNHPIPRAWLRRVEKHWAKPPGREDLGYFWVHELFRRMIGDDAEDEAEARAAWALVPRVTGEYGVPGPHYWVEYDQKLRPQPTREYMHVIQNNRETPMWKLTNHDVKLTDVGRDACYWVILEETMRQAKDHTRTADAACESGGDSRDVAVIGPGSRVCLRGLAARPELNGKTGTLLAFVVGSGRWQVQLDDGLGTKLLKEENLVPCPQMEAIFSELDSDSREDVAQRLFAHGEDIGCS